MLIRFDSRAIAQRRLFCLPFAGGGPSTYRQWPASLPSDVEVQAVVLPGRDPRTRVANGGSPPASMSELVESTLAVIEELQTNSPLPFSIFGHSMGALVAYELTVAMEQRSEDSSSAAPASTPTTLFLSGRRPADELHSGELIHRLGDEQFLDAMQRSYGGVPDVIRGEPELLALFLPGLRADVEVFETYAPLTARRIACPVRVYGGVDDLRPKPELLAGWQRLAEQMISVRTFPGDHFYLNDGRLDLTADIAAHWPAEPGVTAGPRVTGSP